MPGLFDFKTDDADDSKPGAAEPELQSAFNNWKQNPGQESNAAMLQTLQPHIYRAAKAQLQNPSPVAMGKAKTIALQSLQSYDPAKGKLVTHLYNHMQGLKRYMHQATAGLQIPERLMRDHKAIDLAEQELTAELGRDPNDDEISDRLGMHPDRLRKARRIGTVSSGFFAGLDEAGSPYDPGVRSEQSPAIHRAVYDDLGPMDKVVFEHGLGHNGQPVLQNQQIAKKLRRSPGWVSQRKVVIQQLLDQAENLPL